MNQSVIFVPVLAHVLLVFVLYIKLAAEKKKAIRLGGVDRKATALDTKAWPEAVVKVSNNIGNQFESPVLFYILSIILFLTNSVNGAVLSLMAVYTISRYVHSYFHVTSNYVPNRFKAFLVGMLILLGLTLWQMIMLLGSAF